MVVLSPLRNPCRPRLRGRCRARAGGHGRRLRRRSRRRCRTSCSRRCGSAAVTAATASTKRRDHAIQEPVVGVQLRHVPHHDAAEARVLLLGVGDDGTQGRGVDVTAARGRRRGHTDEDLDVGVLARIGRPVVPDVKVPRVRVREVNHAAPVVVELDVDPVEGDCAVEHLVHRRVRVHALRRRGEVVLLATVSVHQAAQLLRKRHEVLGAGLEVEVEPVDDGRAEGPVRRIRVRPEEIPDGLGGRGRRSRVAEAALVVGRAADRQQDRLALLLAVLDVLPTVFLVSLSPKIAAGGVAVRWCHTRSRGR